MTAMMKPLCVDLRVATNSVDLGGEGYSKSSQIVLVPNCHLIF